MPKRLNNSKSKSKGKKKTNEILDTTDAFFLYEESSGQFTPIELVE